jgi:hypothetical protein
MVIPGGSGVRDDVRAGRISPSGTGFGSNSSRAAIVLVTGRLDDDAAAKAAARAPGADAGGGRPIELHLDSPDRTLETIFVLIDTADALRSTLRVLCRGEVGGSPNALGGVGIYQRKAAS